ncbi:MAG: efflux RND transporter periplasmic adaptor subunit [Thermoanaerobaculia bacterium]|nr:efflux RND transporter periplasmic adaptor subunit [Thermoanaerobaculia bacterium]
MRKWLRRLAVLVALAAVALLLRATVLAPEPVPVDVQRAERGAVEETVTNSRAGTVTARQRAKMSPEVGGRVVALPHREGDRVEAGQVVLELDARALEARLALARGEAEAAAAERRRACLTAERADRESRRVARLAAERIVSEDLLDQAESAAQTAAAACAAAEANESRAAASVAVARAELAKTVLVAPFDGVVAEVSIEVGEWTTPSPPALPVPPVIDILDPSSLYVSAPMDEVDSARIEVGQPARVTVDSHRDRVFDARVSRIAPYVLDLEQQNRTVEVEVDFVAAPDAVLLPGTSADVEVVLATREEVLRVPTAALLENRRLLLLEGDRLVEREVETGLRNWQYTEIVSGLEGGELVVTSLDRVEVKAGALAERRDAETSGDG